MKPDLSEIKPVAWAFDCVHDFDGWTIKGASERFLKDSEELYDQSALEAAHEAGRRAGLEEAIGACHTLGKVSSRRWEIAEECANAINELLEQKS